MKNHILFSGFGKLCLFMLLSVALLGSCSEVSDPLSETSQLTPSPTASSVETTSVPAQGTKTTLDFGTWNLEWFGDTENGPGDEALQLKNVHYIMSELNMDLWSVQEVTSVAHFENLVSQLSGYEGFLANDPLVINGPEYYNDFDNNELKVGIIYKSSITTIHSAKVILTKYDYEFAGRPPVEVQLTTSIDGISKDFVMILLHAKAGSGRDDWDRRKAASDALKSYIDNTWPTENVMVIGDFNDDVDESITKPNDSPYQNFVGDTADYTFSTKALSDAGISSTVYYSDMIDHHLSSNELIAMYQDSSVQVLPADQYIADYDQTTSDHYPVLSNFILSESGGDNNSPPTASFTFNCPEFTCDFDGTGSSDSDGTISSYSWNFGDGATATGATVNHTYAAEGTYTVTLSVIDDSGATDSNSQDVSISESSADGINLLANGYKVKGLKKVDLSWSGATLTNMDIYRDGNIIATTANDGAHTDDIGQRGGGSYVYQVCESGAETCSNEVSVSF